MAESSKNILLDDLTGHESERTLTPTSDKNIAARRRTMDEEAPAESGGKEVKTLNPTQEDPNAVGWDGHDDPNNPLNWPAKRKWSNIVALSIMTILTYATANPVSPVEP